MLAKTIAEVHNVGLRDINKIINNNIEEFEIGIDMLDLKDNENFAVVLKNSGLYTQNAYNASKNIYLLSEQGYMLLVGFMKTKEGFKDYLNPLRFLTDLSFKTILKSEIPTLEI